ncbi:MAG: alpha/beta hydrolase, partial [Anaerolineae bacterium]
RQGFRVLAPDQRGYNRSSAPAAVSAYAITNLVRDVIALLDALDIPQVNLAGHDWGAAVAWHTALQHPDRVRRLAIANVPHPAVMRRFLRHSPRQMLKSWYIFFFQIPGLAEFLLEARDFNLAVRSLQRSGLPGTFAPDELERYRQSWKTAGGLRGMIHWYRAALRYPPPEPADPVLRMPVLILWGKRDIALHSAMAEASMAYCPQGRLVAFDDASHWVMRDRPAEVNRELSEHFGM